MIDPSVGERERNAAAKETRGEFPSERGIRKGRGKREERGATTELATAVTRASKTRFVVLVRGFGVPVIAVSPIEVVCRCTVPPNDTTTSDPK